MHMTINTRFILLLQLVKTFLLLPALLTACCGPWLAHAGQLPIGEVAAWQGTVQLKGVDGMQALPASLKIHDGDIIVTGDASWASLELHDASRLVLGPGTVIKVSLATRDNRHYLDLDLEQGLMRIASGLACLRNLQDCSVTTPYGRMALFASRADVWICDDDCSERSGDPSQRTVNPAGRVVYLDGQLFLTGIMGVKKPLLVEDPVFISDELEMADKSCAVVAFADGSILSARDGQRFNASDPGLRRGAGACSDWQPAGGLDFRALFGVRETGTLSYGVYTRVHDGHIRMGEGDNTTGIGRNEAGYMGNGPPVRISSWPSTALLNSVPDPATMIRRAR